jgi:hypothetical protein
MTKYKTVVFDSVGELARLYFSKDIGKTASDTEKIRAVNNYVGTTERLNMIVRRCKDLRNQGVEVVFLAHEDIQKVYGRGGAITAKGQTPQEPVSIKGQLDLPGNRTPDEFSRAADNIFHVRFSMGKPVWIGRREALSNASDFWEVKDRFNAPAISAGQLPASYSELAKMALANPLCNWDPPYIWILYGPPGVGKTRSLLSFPTPMKLFDLDFGSKSIARDVRLANEKEPGTYDIVDNINPEHGPDYEKFMKEFATLFV